MFRKKEQRNEDTQSKLTPLDRIRQEEARMASLILLARQEAEEAKIEAIRQAEQVKARARDKGNQAGQARCKEIIQDTTMEAQRILVEARAKADEIAQAGHSRIPEDVQWAVNIVLGSGRDKG